MIYFKKKKKKKEERQRKRASRERGRECFRKALSGAIAN